MDEAEITSKFDLIGANQVGLRLDRKGNLEVMLVYTDENMPIYWGKISFKEFRLMVAEVEYGYRKMGEKL